MRRLLIAAVIALFPLFGFAQQEAPPGTLAERVRVLGVNADQLIAVGLGVLGGGVGLHLLLGGGSATLVGALAGAMIGNWWYEQKKADPGDRTMTVRYSGSTR